MATGDSERGGPSQRRAVQLDAVRVMEQSVTDGVCLIGVADDGVPIGDGQLTGDEGRGALDAIFDDLREVPRCRSRRQHEVHVALAPHGALEPSGLPEEFSTPAGSPFCNCWWVAVFD